MVAPPAMLFDAAVLADIKAHAIAAYPQESCGIVTATGYVALANTSPDPHHEFDCTAELEPHLAAGAVLALVHSHPDGPLAPTAYDMRQAMAMDVPWGLIVCDKEAALPVWYWHEEFDPPPLVGRPFRFGPSGTDGRGDCAALVRDWYRLERDIRLPEYPREDKWWLQQGVSYRQNLLNAGFQDANRRDPQPGDVFLAAIRSRVANHAGIYLGSGKILHHLAGRFSAEDSGVSWMPFVTDWLRHA
jgi:proteasome lid subunit RPN8/RPN11